MATTTNLYPRYPVLMVDDEIEALQGSEYVLRAGKVNHILACSDPRKVEGLLKENPISLVICDLSMPHLSGEEVLTYITEHYPHIPVIILTGSNEVEVAVRCMQAGAFDYMVKPIEGSRLISGVKRAVEMCELRQEYNTFKQRILSGELQRPECFEEMVTQHAKMMAIFQYGETIAGTSWPVLITGETGVGKELFARAVHRLSERKGDLVAVNVAGLDDHVFSDTLFGHNRGAFTGAEKMRPGLIAQAADGTLFLDEIGDMSHTSQVKLLRVLQEKRYYPLGEDMPKQTNARVIVATNRNLKKMQEEGTFRADLFYRLQTHHIHLPPLRERREDIPLLLNHFLERAAQTLNKKVPAYPKSLPLLLQTYPFPGNIREMEAMVVDALSHHEGAVLSMDRFKQVMGNEQAIDEMEVEGESLFANCEKLPSLKDVQKILIQEALQRAHGNQTIAARMLGMTQSGLSKALKRAGE